MPKTPEKKERFYFRTNPLDGEALKEYFLPAVVAVSIAYAIHFALAHFFPVTKYSVVLAVLDFAKVILNRLFGWDIDPIMLMPIFAIGFWILVLATGNGNSTSSERKGTGILFVDSALSEEIEFRMGSENWTILERIKGCIGFGLIHLINLVFPLSICLALISSGFFFMLVYLHNFKLTGDQELATKEAAKFHALFNYVSIGGIMAFIIGGFIYVIIMTFVYT